MLNLIWKQAKQKGLGKSQSRKSGLTAIYLIKLTRAALGTRRKISIAIPT